MNQIEPDMKLVNAAVKIKITIMRNKAPVLRLAELSKDLRRLIDQMNSTEYQLLKERVS